MGLPSLSKAAPVVTTAFINSSNYVLNKKFSGNSPATPGFQTRFNSVYSCDYIVLLLKNSSFPLLVFTSRLYL